MKRATHVVLALLLVTTVLAGCVQVEDVDPQAAPTPSPGDNLATRAGFTNLSPPRFDALPLETVTVPSFDGTPLHAAVVRPDVPNGTKVPVVINYSPYFGNAAPPVTEGGDGFSRWLVEHLVPRGYAVVIQSVRGTGDSGGCFTMGDVREQRDTYELVEWYATRSWSSGDVGLIGKSYDGTTANQGIVTAPPHLRTIVPIGAISEWYNYLYKGGVPYDYGIQQGTTFNARYWAFVDLGLVPSYDPTAVAREQNLRHAPESVCPEVLEGAREGVSTGVTGDYTSYWRERGYVHDADHAGNTSVFLVHGLQDWNVKPDQITPWYQRLEDAGVPTKAWLGQWEHVYPTRADWNATLLAWFDRWLKHRDTGIMDEPAVQVQDSTGLWRHETTWPPERAVDTTFHLWGRHTSESVGLLQRDAPDASSTVAWTDDAAARPNPPDPAPHYAAYATDALGETLRVSGTPELHLEMTSTKPYTHVVAVVYDVAPDGSWEEVNYGFLDVRHRNGLEEGTPVEPGEAYTYDVELFPMDHAFQEGHRVGLALASSYPLFVRTSGTHATNIVTLGGEEPAHLTLPTIQEVTPEEEQPRMLEPGQVPGN